MLGTWKVNGDGGTDRFSQYTNTVQQSRSLRRNNARRACHFCRTKKLKCSGDVGSCDRCRSLGSRCKYPQSAEERWRARDDEFEEEHHVNVGSRARHDSRNSGFDEVVTQSIIPLYETASLHIDSIEDTLSLNRALSNGDDDEDGMHTSSDDPSNCEEQILIDYILHAGTHASDQIRPACLSTTAETDYTPWTDLSWEAAKHSYDNDGGKRLAADTFEPSATSPLNNEVHGNMPDDATSNPCECLRTAAHVLHELSTHASLAVSSNKPPSLDQHLEILNSSIRRLHAIPHCTSCRTRSENMMVNAMALQQLCIVCEQMSEVADSDSSNCIDIRIGQFQVPNKGSERAKISAAIVLSQLNILNDLVKEFKMVSACMPTPFALLQSIEHKIQRLCAVHHT